MKASNGPKVIARPACSSCGATDVACESRRFLSPRAGCCEQCDHRGGVGATSSTAPPDPPPRGRVKSSSARSA